MRQLLSVALLTNRTVVMPKLLCYCDRYWGPVERCRLPGATRMQLPFICPLDHIFEPFHFDDHPDRFGPAFAYREHSFFDNERTPSAVKDGAHFGGCILGALLSELCRSGAARRSTQEEEGRDHKS